MNIGISCTDVALNTFKNKRFKIWLYNLSRFGLSWRSAKCRANRWDFVGQLVLKFPNEQTSASKISGNSFLAERTAEVLVKIGIDVPVTF